VKAHICAELEITVVVPWDVIMEIPARADIPDLCHLKRVLEAAGCFPTQEELTVNLRHDERGALFESMWECSASIESVDLLPSSNKDEVDVYCVKQEIVTKEQYRAHVAAEKRKQAYAPLPGQMTVPGV
jgi:hypothetical protein